MNWFSNMKRFASNDLITWIELHENEAQEFVNSDPTDTTLPDGFYFDQDEDGFWSVMGANGFKVGTREVSIRLVRERAKQLMGYILKSFLSKAAKSSRRIKKAEDKASADGDANATS